MGGLYGRLIDDDLWRFVSLGPYRVDHLQAVGNVGVVEYMIAQGNKQKENDKISELRGALPPVVYNYIRGCKFVKKKLGNIEGEIPRE